MNAIGTLSNIGGGGNPS